MGLFNSVNRCCLDSDNLQRDPEKIQVTLPCAFQCRECNRIYEADGIEIIDGQRCFEIIVAPPEGYMAPTYLVRKIIPN